MKSCQLHDVTSCIMSKEKATEKGLEKKKKNLKMKSEVILMMYYVFAHPLSLLVYGFSCYF